MSQEYNSHASQIVNNFLWTFNHVSSSTQAPYNPSTTADGQHTTTVPCPSNAPGVWSRGLCGLHVTLAHCVAGGWGGGGLEGAGCGNAPGSGGPLTFFSFARTLEELWAITPSECREKLSLAAILSTWLVVEREIHPQACLCQLFTSHELTREKITSFEARTTCVTRFLTQKNNDSH